MLFYRNCHYSQYDYNKKVTKDTVTISGLDLTGYTVQLKDADPNELQLFIEKMPASIKGKNVKYNSSKLCLVLVLE